MKPLVIYHSPCYDGFTAAWVAHRYFKKLPPEILEEAPIYHPAQYESKPPDCMGKDVFILDFSYPRKDLINIHMQANSLLVLDHHETAEANLKGLSYCVFDMKRSGCRMAWDWFFAGEAPPQMLLRLEDRDLWKFHYDDTKAAQAYAGTLEQTFLNWDEFMQDSLLVYHTGQGEGVVKYIAMYGKRAREHVRIHSIANFFVPTMNMAYMNCSEHLNALLESYEATPAAVPDFVASYFMKGDGRWQFSLRSKGDFNVSKIAESFGGGGHRNSAGFTVSTLPWELKGSDHTESDPAQKPAKV